MKFVHLFLYLPLLSSNYTTCQHLSSITKQLKKIKTLSPHRQRIKKRKIPPISKKYIVEQEQQLIKCFSSTSHQTITQEEFKQSILMFSEYNNFPILHHYRATIIMALSELYEKEGFTRVMKLAVTNLHNSCSLLGYLYEIEKGLEIETIDNNETVLAFQTKITSPRSNITREFDIETNLRLIECKNINWKNKKIKQQLVSQRKIVDELNINNPHKLLYEVCSKKPIPQNWQKWLKNKNILFSSDS